MTGLFVEPTACGEGKKCSVGIELSSQTPVTPAVEESLRELGIDYVNFFVMTAPDQAEPSSEKVTKQMTALCDRLGFRFSLSVHHLDPPDSAVRTAARSPNFEGMVLDEVEHVRMLQPYEYVPPALLFAKAGELTTCSQADQAARAGFEGLRRKFQALGAHEVTSTHVWPALHSAAARAGLTICPKICKETYSPVSLGIGLGAALQYGRPLWADCDLWYYDLLPGHTPEEFRCNLLLAYWLGVDRIYVEGSGLNLLPQGKQGVPFALLTQATPDIGQLTAHGLVLRWFCREYVRANPRSWTFRDLQPDVAIVRFDDTCHGQRQFGNDWLFGSTNLHTTLDNEAWFGIWNLLTWNSTGTDGLTYFKARISQAAPAPTNYHTLWPNYLSRPAQAAQHNFFVPLRGTVVYDDQIGYERLKGIPLIFLAGVQVSEPTLAAIHRCVNEGSLCVAWGNLVRGHGFADWQGGTRIYPEGKGRFVITDDFQSPEVSVQTKGLIGKPNEISYRFAGRRVTLVQKEPNQVSVGVVEEK